MVGIGEIVFILVIVVLVFGAKRISQTTGHRDQELVPHVMAVFIIDRLESVQVQQGDQDPGTMPFSIGNLTGQLLQQGTAIGEFRQGVGQ